LNATVSKDYGPCLFFCLALNDLPRVLVKAVVRN